MQSGPIPNNAKTQVAMNVEVLEPSFVRFARRVSSEGGWDFLRFFVNGVQMDAWSGELGWEEVGYFVNQPGPTELKWSYEKDGWVAEGADAAWIDDIILPLVQLPDDTISTGVRDASLTLDRYSVFPNPAHSSAQVQFSLNQSALVSLTLFNGHGQQVQPIFEGQLGAGTFAKGISTDELAAGVYWLALRAGDDVRVLKLIIQ